MLLFVQPLFVWYNENVESQRRLFYLFYVNERGIVAMAEVYSVLAFVLLLVALAKVIDNIKK
ncbi:MAG TPA: hypothetical protein DCY72_00675 [Ruminococcaceae bacterium]|nr:hypothetical protein [Oscillospiraceae bacterium]